MRVPTRPTIQDGQDAHPTIEDNLFLGNRLCSSPVTVLSPI